MLGFQHDQEVEDLLRLSCVVPLISLGYDVATRLGKYVLTSRASDIYAASQILALAYDRRRNGLRRKC
jgi:hypothetical protein